MKDWLCSLLRKRSSKNGRDADMSSDKLDSPLSINGLQKTLEMEMHDSLNSNDSQVDLYAQEEGKPLIDKHGDNHNMLKQNRELTTWDIATYGFYIAPIWFITEVRHCHRYCIFLLVLFVIFCCFVHSDHMMWNLSTSTMILLQQMFFCT